MMREFYKKELSPFVLCIASIAIFSTLSVFGIIYNLGKSIYHCFGRGPLYAISSFLLYWLMVLYQIWNVYKYLAMHIAIAFDLFGNATSGEMIEDVVTSKEKTLFGKGDVTISQATGELQAGDQLNSNGVKFNNTLSIVLGENHSIESYKKWLKNNL